jgi:hypothetical protein
MNLDINTIVLFIVVIAVLYILYKISKHEEHFADPTALTIDNIRDEINKQYNMDIEAMRNLGAISKSLLTGTNYHSTTVGTPGTLTIPADNTNLMGSLTLNGSLNMQAWQPLNWNGRANFETSSDQFVFSAPGGVTVYKDAKNSGNLTVGGSLSISGTNVKDTLTNLQNSINSLQNQVNNKVQLGGAYGIGTYGGGGGGGFDIRCPGNQVMTGLYGGSGAVVDRVGPICR